MEGRRIQSVWGDSHARQCVHRGRGGASSANRAHGPGGRVLPRHITNRRGQDDIVSVAVKLQLLGTLVASAYGPGLYGNTTACGQTLQYRTVGVAHKTLPCGTMLRVCTRGKCADIPVIDRGPFSGNRSLDVTEGTTRRVWGMSARQWGVRGVKTWRVKARKQGAGKAPSKRDSV